MLSAPRLLDLFCGAGGATRGYQRAGFEVWGIDNTPQPHYVGDHFTQADALEVEPWFLSAFDAIHASPPCQAYSVLGKRWRGRTWPDLLAPTRELLRPLPLPWVLENVPGAPIRASVMLCGGGFMPPVRCDDGRLRQLRRHRYFELNWPLLGHPCHHPLPALGVYGNGRWSNDASTHRGGYQGNKRENAEAMGIDWMNRDELSEAIPPAYTEMVGRELLRHLRREVAA